jgi:hypothetical protein
VTAPAPATPRQLDAIACQLAAIASFLRSVGLDAIARTCLDARAALLATRGRS